VSKINIVAVFLVAALVFSPPSTARYAAIVIDGDTGKVIHENEATQRWYPASLTKVLTIYLTFCALKSGELHLHDQLITSKHAAMQPRSKLGLLPGQHISVEHAIMAVTTRSANDAAVILAERLGGTEAEFAKMMTHKARQIGMISSSFENASGLPNEGQISSARDLALLSLNLINDFPEYYHYFSLTEFNYHGQLLSNTNRILRSYPDADGMKTGFTCGSGFNLIASAKRNGHRVIGVLLGARSSAERFEQMENLLDLGFAKSGNLDRDLHVAALKTADFSPPPFQLSSNRCAGSAALMGAEPEYGHHQPIRIGDAQARLVNLQESSSALKKSHKRHKHHATQASSPVKAVRSHTVLAPAVKPISVKASIHSASCHAPAKCADKKQHRNNQSIKPAALRQPHP